MVTFSILCTYLTVLPLFVTVIKSYNNQNHKMIQILYIKIKYNTNFNTNFSSIGNGSPLACCNPDGSTPDILPKGCLSIKNPQNDLAKNSKNRFFLSTSYEHI